MSKPHFSPELAMLRDLISDYARTGGPGDPWYDAGVALDGLQEQLETVQRRNDWLRIQLDGIIEDAEARFRSIGSGTGLSGGEGQSARAFLANLRAARVALDGSFPAISRRIEVEITGDGSGVALPPIVEGLSPPRTWNPSGGAGALPASSSDAAGAEESSPAKRPS